MQTVSGRLGFIGVRERARAGRGHAGAPHEPTLGRDGSALGGPGAAARRRPRAARRPSLAAPVDQSAAEEEDWHLPLATRQTPRGGVSSSAGGVAREGSRRHWTAPGLRLDGLESGSMKGGRRRDLLGDWKNRCDHLFLTRAGCARNSSYHIALYFKAVGWARRLAGKPSLWEVSSTNEGGCSCRTARALANRRARRGAASPPPTAGPVAPPIGWGRRVTGVSLPQ